jgi:hypothetical protein
VIIRGPGGERQQRQRERGNADHELRTRGGRPKFPGVTKTFLMKKTRERAMRPTNREDRGVPVSLIVTHAMTSERLDSMSASVARAIQIECEADGTVA